MCSTLVVILYVVKLCNMMLCCVTLCSVMLFYIELMFSCQAVEYEAAEKGPKCRQSRQKGTIQ